MHPLIDYGDIVTSAELGGNTRRLTLRLACYPCGILLRYTVIVESLHRDRGRLAVDIPEGVVLPYELITETRSHRCFMVPAVVVNAHGGLEMEGSLRRMINYSPWGDPRACPQLDPARSRSASCASAEFRSAPP